MSFFVVCAVALLASGLTFFSGFGLGTLLLPAFALFFPVEQAIAMTALVHLLNGLFKLGLVGRQARLGVVLRFGLPALVAAVIGAGALQWLAGLEPVYRINGFGLSREVMPIKLAVGLLLAAFAGLELSRRWQALAFPPAWMPLGGLLSGFFGGLAGMQGALRSAFLIRAGLSKEGFIATGVVCAVLVDVSRLGVYAGAFTDIADRLDYPLLAAAVLSAFAGAWAGNRFLRRMTLAAVQRLVAVALLAVALAMMTGWV